jgi:D-alanyl-D-alanine carboxypeptidase
MPIINAKSALAIDVDSHTILYKKNLNEQLSFASLAKLMTAIIIIEENYLTDNVLISNNPKLIEGTKVGLKSGENFTFQDLLYLLLIPSGNDVAIALAEANSGTIENFVDKMNKKAKFLGLKNTYFTNPVGLDDAKQKSTVLDLANLSLHAIKKPLIRKIVQNKTIEIKSNRSTYNESNTNQLLNSYLNILGLKTGTTDEAGQCLITLARNNNGHEILTVVLNSKNRFQETKALIDWVWQAYQW